MGWGRKEWDVDGGWEEECKRISCSCSYMYGVVLSILDV